MADNEIAEFHQRASAALTAAIQAAGLGYDQVTREWLLAFDPAWIYRESDTPFHDFAHNQAYRRFLDRE